MRVGDQEGPHDAPQGRQIELVQGQPLAEQAAGVEPPRTASKCSTV